MSHHWHEDVGVGWCPCDEDQEAPGAPVPAAPDRECAEPLCTTTSPHHTHTDADGRSWCCHEYPYTPTVKAAPDTTGGPREVERLIAFVHEWDNGERDYFQVAEDITDLLRWWLPALRDLLALRDLIAERDTLAAKVQAVEALAEDYEGYVADRGRPAPGSFDHGLNMAQKAAALDLRRALGTPTAGGGE
jgi:hypothetical protein